MTGGCYGDIWQKEIEGQTFPVYLKANGYNTFYAGKYLNQVCNQAFWCVGGSMMKFEHAVKLINLFLFSWSSQKYRSKDIPPGFTDWYGLHGNSKYYNYTLNENGTLKHFGDQEQEYLTDVLVSSSYLLCFY